MRGLFDGAKFVLFEKENPLYRGYNSLYIGGNNY